MNKYREEFEKKNPKTSHSYRDGKGELRWQTRYVEYLESKLEDAEKKIEKLLALHNVKESFCGECVYYLTCRHESRDKRICEHYDNQP